MVCVNMCRFSSWGQALKCSLLLTTTCPIPFYLRVSIYQREAEVHLSGVMQVLWNAREARAEWAGLVLELRKSCEGKVQPRRPCESTQYLDKVLLQSSGKREALENHMCNVSSYSAFILPPLILILFLTLLSPPSAPYGIFWTLLPARFGHFCLIPSLLPN